MKIGHKTIFSKHLKLLQTHSKTLRLVSNKQIWTDTHLYGHAAQLSGRTGVVAALRGQQPVIRPEGEKDEDGRQRPKDPGEEQCHAQLHGPPTGPSLCRPLASTQSVAFLLQATASACDETRPQPTSAMKPFSWRSTGCWMWTCGLLSPLPVLWEDRLEHMTPVDPAGVCCQPTHTPTRPPRPGGLFWGF